MAESSPRRRRRRWLLPVVFVLLAVAAVLSVATYVFFFYDGASKSVPPGEAYLLSDGISNFFCKGEEIHLESRDSSLHFEASVISAKKLNSRVPQTDNVNVSPVLKDREEHVFWPFYLPSDARINVQQCITGSTSSRVMSVIVKGQDISNSCIQEWQKYVSGASNSDSDEDDSKPSCPGLFVQPLLVQRCSGSKQQIAAKVTDPGYYSVLYGNIGQQSAQVVASISITRLTYDLRSSLFNCSSAKLCVLPVRIFSRDTVVVQVAMTTKAVSVPVKWSCVRRSATFATVFAAVPLVILVTIAIIISCRRRKKRQRDGAQPVPESAAEPSERTPLLDNDYGNPRDPAVHETTAPELPDPILSKVGPIPGPYQYRPSAPPNLSPEILDASPSQEEQEVTFPREPPPSYEETMKTKPEE